MGSKFMKTKTQFDFAGEGSNFFPIFNLGSPTVKDFVNFFTLDMSPCYCYPAFVYGIMCVSFASVVFLLRKQFLVLVSLLNSGAI